MAASGTHPYSYSANLQLAPDTDYYDSDPVQQAAVPQHQYNYASPNADYRSNPVRPQAGGPQWAQSAGGVQPHLQQRNQPPRPQFVQPQPHVYVDAAAERRRRTMAFDASKCEQLTGFSKRQIRICKKHVEIMDSVRLGARMAIIECQYQFRTRRWNCTIVGEAAAPPGRRLQQSQAPPAAGGNNVRRDVRPQSSGGSSDDSGSSEQLPEPPAALGNGTREAAFVNAIAAAGVAHGVTKDCSRGLIDSCGCEDPTSLPNSTRGDFTWSGCSDNVHFGVLFSRKFVNAYERRREQSVERMLMNLHNNEAGRIALKNHMRVQCKCHGVSGSCNLRTCTRVMPTFRQVGDLLKAKFDGATEVRAVIDERDRVSLVPAQSRFKRHTAADLVYLDPSPNYCTADPHTGIPGTTAMQAGATWNAGRECSADSAGIDGCMLLCCNRGYNTTVERRHNTQCKCEFHWCCRVQCTTCIEHIVVHRCL